jgi:hypothetical protein
MARLRAIRTDQQKAEAGVWVPYAEDIEVCVASLNSKTYQDHRERLMAPHLKMARAKRMSPEQVLEIVRPAVAKHLIRDWKNIQDDDGVDIPYSPQKAEEILSDPGMLDFYDFILDAAGNVTLFRQEMLEDGRGN